MNAEKDKILINFITSQTSLSESFLNSIAKNKKMKMITVDANEAFKKYRVLTNNCNDFTDEALNAYYGENWAFEIITDADNLINNWDKRYNLDGTKK